MDIILIDLSIYDMYTYIYVKVESGVAYISQLIDVDSKRFLSLLKLHISLTYVNRS